MIIVNGRYKVTTNIHHRTIITDRSGGTLSSQSVDSLLLFEAVSILKEINQKLDSITRVENFFCKGNQ